MFGTNNAPKKFDVFVLVFKRHRLPDKILAKDVLEPLAKVACWPVSNQSLIMRQTKVDGWVCQGNLSERFQTMPICSALGTQKFTSCRDFIKEGAHLDTCPLWSAGGL